MPNQFHLLLVSHRARLKCNRHCVLQEYIDEDKNTSCRKYLEAQVVSCLPALGGTNGRDFVFYLKNTHFVQKRHLAINGTQLSYKCSSWLVFTNGCDCEWHMTGFSFRGVSGRFCIQLTALVSVHWSEAGTICRDTAEWSAHWDADEQRVRVGSRVRLKQAKSGSSILKQECTSFPSNRNGKSHPQSSTVKVANTSSHTLSAQSDVPGNALGVPQVPVQCSFSCLVLSLWHSGASYWRQAPLKLHLLRALKEKIWTTARWVEKASLPSSTTSLLLSSLWFCWIAANAHKGPQMSHWALHPQLLRLPF